FVNRDGNLLPTAPTEGGKYIASSVDGGIRDGMQILGDGNAHRDGHRGARAAAVMHGELAANRTLRHADNDAVGGTDEQAAGLAPKEHLRAARTVFCEPASPNCDLTA